MPSSSNTATVTQLTGANRAYLEDLYAQFRQDPQNVPENWRYYFMGMDDAGPAGAPGGQSAGGSVKQNSVDQLMRSYRLLGHQHARIDPLEAAEAEPVPDLDPGFHGLDEGDMDTAFPTNLGGQAGELPLRDLVDRLRAIYCGTLASEFMHITNTEERRWLVERIESTQGMWHTQHEAAARRRALELINAAEGLERYLHTRYVGQKRFSLEGGETLVTALDEIIQRGGTQGVREIVIGMAHRGRLNVLVNILGKPPQQLFTEFEGVHDTAREDMAGDVKYHQGFSSDVATPGGPVHLALAFNPSHLEIVSPVVEGSVKARQVRREDGPGSQVLPVLIHGDAAFAGQGVVTETLNLCKTAGYGTGGTIHIIVNNQIGFTTSKPLEARSTLHCTEVAKLIQAPILHVNGDDPDAVLFAAQVALDYRMKFRNDVVIDLVCYRRHGHNEADEPMVTQPIMYQRIKSLPTTRELYAQRLVKDQVLSDTDAGGMIQSYRDALQGGGVPPHIPLENVANEFAVDWHPYLDGAWDEDVKTGVPMDVLQELADRLLTLPENFALHSRVKKILDSRRKMAAGEMPLDWGMAETLAYGTLLREGYPIRLSGQDCGRGTFFHRHAVLHHQKQRINHTPLGELLPDQPSFVVINSLLSELAVLGFEYGYATSDPETLVVWEAQFGDFANGAQMIIDQFISSGYEKWGRVCGLTLFLPHGFEGQGPEHSSARLERFLQLCANYNQQVCAPTTPGQFFHLLRRQMLRRFRRPLVVMTPKSLLRHRRSTSPLEELADGVFRTVLPEQALEDDGAVKRVVLCSGKVYFDLVEAREQREDAHTAIVRIEQLYPFPRPEVTAELARYANAKQVVWCQEEPQNQGPWYQIRHHLQACIGDDQTLDYAGRAGSSSPATGYSRVHAEQQQSLVEQALA